MSLEEELKLLIKGDVHSDAASLEKYSTDASIFQITPKLVVSPKNSEDIKKLVTFVTKKRKESTKGSDKLSLTARSAGTDMSGGPLSESIIIDFTKYFTHMGEVNLPLLEAKTEPGVYYRDFERETLKKNLIMPSYPASREICCVGGIVANNSGGEKTLRYGKTENYVKKLKVVLADGNEYVVRPLTKHELEKKEKEPTFEGEVYRKLHKLIEENYDDIKAAKPKVSKNSAGYFLWNVWDRKNFDLTKLFVGSEGTLGLITEVTFQLVKKKSYDRLVAVFLNNTENLGKLTKEILKHDPETLESYDDQTLKLAIRFIPDIVRILKPKNALKLALQFIPETLMMIRNGRLPKLVLLVEFAGDDPKEVDGRVETLKKDLEPFNLQMRITKGDDEEKKYWTIRRESFNLLRHHLSGKHTAPFIDDFVVLPEYLPEFLPRLNKILEAYKEHMIYTIAGHVGDGNFHIIPIMDFKNPSIKKVIKEVAEKVYDLVIEYKGSTTGEHNDGLIRTPFLEKMYGKKICKLFEETKNIFDPENIFNPGKKVNSNFSWSLDHLRKT